jgi:vacuolar protein sorting-associated protein 13D
VLETACLKVCIIDDCRDADVPLLEMTLVDLSLNQKYCGPGDVSATFGVDYYNRVLSGWEPVVEQWRATLHWEQSLASSVSPKRLKIQVNSPDSVNVNVTSTFVELVTLVKENWTLDYYLLSDFSKGSTATTCSTVAPQPTHLTRLLFTGNNKNYRRRSPFVPFALKNETCSKMWFKTLIATAEVDKIVDKEFLKSNALERDETWLEVAVGDTVPFTFENRGKLRHHSTHIARRHQVAVIVEGWKVVDPVTVDRVGVYFRHALADFKGSEVNNKQRFILTTRVISTFNLMPTICV